MHYGKAYCTSETQLWLQALDDNLGFLVMLEKVTTGGVKVCHILEGRMHDEMI